MIRMMVRHDVTDYDTWRKAYDDFDAERAGMGVRGDGVYRAVDNPNDSVTEAGLRILAHPRSTVEPLAPFFEEWPGGGYARERAALALGDQLHGFAVASASNEELWAFEEYLDGLSSGERWAAVGEGERARDRYTVSPPGHPRTYAWIGPGWSPSEISRHCTVTGL